jgi:2-iminobutanoate/2-iminopropanoate deaminase
LKEFIEKKIINTIKAPAAIGPYSQAITVNKFVFVSGQIPFDPETMELVSNDIGEQTRQCLKNVQTILETSGSDLNKVVKVTIFICDMEQFGTINEVYSEFFKVNPPARACVEVSRLPKDVQVEIEVIAHL